MNFRIFTAALSFVATVLVSPAAAYACDDRLAETFDVQIRQARAAKAWATMSDAALRLAGLYDGCAASENGRRYYEDAMRMANALLSAGAAELERHRDDDARHPFTVARSIFYVTVSATDAPEDVKDDARQRLQFLQKRLPWLLQVAVDPSVMPHVRPPRDTSAANPIAAAPAPAATEFDVLTSWITPYTGPLQALHVKLNLHPRTTTTLSAADFRIIMLSHANGRESVYGRGGAAPAYRKPDWSGSSNQYRLVPTVDPSEDLGAQGSFTVHAGDAVTRVVTFVVRSDAELNPETLATLTWNHR